MKNLKINITKAMLTGFSVELKEGKPEVNATIALLTDGGKAITTYSIGTEYWRDPNDFELPVGLMPLIGQIARELEAIAVRKCQQGQGALPAPKKKRKPEQMTAEEIDEINDQAVKNAASDPINLDDIPF